MAHGRRERPASTQPNAEGVHYFSREGPSIAWRKNGSHAMQRAAVPTEKDSCHALLEKAQLVRDRHNFFDNQVMHRAVPRGHQLKQYLLVAYSTLSTTIESRKAYGKAGLRCIHAPLRYPVLSGMRLLSDWVRHARYRLSHLLRDNRALLDLRFSSRSQVLQRHFVMSEFAIK